MKVLFCTYPTAFQNPGGGEVVLMKLREYLGRRGVVVDLFDPWRMRFGGYDLVHCFSCYTAGLWPEIRVQGAKVVVTPIHYPRLRHWRLRLARASSVVKRNLFPSRFRLGLEHCLAAVDLLLPNSRAEAAAICAAYGFPESRVRVIPNGVDASFLEGGDSFPSKYGVTDYLLTVGRISRNKNQLSMIRAARRIGKPLVVVGEPDAGERDYYAECVRAAGEGNALLTGRLSDDALLASAYANAAAFVLPSFSEILPLVLLEAGLAGTRVLATENEPVRETLGDLLRYVDPSSERSLADGIAAALSLPRPTELREFVRARFLWDGIAARTEAAYRSLLEA